MAVVLVDAVTRSMRLLPPGLQGLPHRDHSQPENIFVRGTFLTDQASKDTEERNRGTHQG